MQRILNDVQWYWPGDYYPTREDHRAVSCVLFVLIWQSWAILAATLLSIIAAVIYRLTKEWRYALVLGVCGWLPCLSLGTVLFWAMVRLGLSFWAEVRLHRGQREMRRLYRRQERLRERRTQRMQMREFNAALVALALPAVEPITEDFGVMDLESGQGNRPVSAGTSSSSGGSSSSVMSGASS